MYTLERLKIELASLINNSLGVDLVGVNDLAYPPDQKMGDLSLPCFVIAKNRRENPAQTAESLLAVLSPGLEKVESKIAEVFCVGPYLNFKIKKENLLKEVLAEIESEKENYGHNNSGERQKTMIEFSNANTHKEFHVGHLRNLCYGDSVHRLMSANGYESIPVSYINDFGIHVAKTLWAYLNFYKDTELPENKGFFLGQVYVRSNKETKDNPGLAKEVNVIMSRIESRNGSEYELWQKTRQWSIEQMANIYKELGVVFAKTYYESETIDEGREMLGGLIEKGVLKESQGALIADMEEQGLGVLVFLRSDGTATYPVADLPLAKKKFDEYGLDASIYVVDYRQDLYFKQLFYIMKQLGYNKPMIHLAYDVVKLPDGMMSSRSGKVVTYEDLKKLLADKIYSETKSRHEDWSEERINKVSNTLIGATIKYEMLKVGAKQPVVFDIEKALSFQGFTAAYLLYTTARISSIIKKSALNESQIRNANNLLLREEIEHELVLKIAKYPDVVKLSAKNFDPSQLAKFIFELAQDFNDYYHCVIILKSEESQKLAKLNLLMSIAQVLKNGLDLLGIGTLEEM